MVKTLKISPGIVMWDEIRKKCNVPFKTHVIGYTHDLSATVKPNKGLQRFPSMSYLPSSLPGLNALIVVPDKAKKRATYLGICFLPHNQKSQGVRSGDRGGHAVFGKISSSHVRLSIPVLTIVGLSSLVRDEAHFWLNGYVNKQNCRIWSEANPQVYVETPLHPEKLTVWCALWAGGILLQKR
ncbi:hypothetical protein TNCV_4332981 [Trichonephila clavipes]|nr:hypothetical protein TNCV_4332981 [Trichonephila clavipes]